MRRDLSSEVTYELRDETEPGGEAGKEPSRPPLAHWSLAMASVLVLQNSTMNVGSKVLMLLGAEEADYDPCFPSVWLPCGRLDVQYSKSPTYKPSSCRLSKMRTCVPSTSGVSEIAACPPSPIADDLSALPSPTYSPSSSQ